MDYYHMKQDGEECSATNGQPLTLAGPNDLPATFDWRTQNIVSPVMDQGGCGSCWTFSTAGTFESHYSLFSKKIGKDQAFFSQQ